MGRKLRLVNVEPKDKKGETYRVITEAGYDLILGRDGWDQPGDEYTEDELIELCRDADAIIIGSREACMRRFIESDSRVRNAVRSPNGSRGPAGTAGNTAAR